MTLFELFPDMPKITFNKIEYELKFDMRSMIQFYIDYPEKIVDEKEITTEDQLCDILNIAYEKMKMNPVDLVNFLHAGLKYTKSFNKESLMDAMMPCFYYDYIHNILLAWQLSKSTPEQLEKMEVMAQANKSKKKAEVEITPANTPITESNVD